MFQEILHSIFQVLLKSMSLVHNLYPYDFVSCLVLFYMVYVTKHQLDLRIGEPMQICIHRKDNSPKPVNHCLTLKEGPKVKFNNRRFLAQDFVQVGFTLQTSRINNKQVISTLRFGRPHLMLKEGLKVKSDHIKRFRAHDFL